MFAVTYLLHKISMSEIRDYFLDFSNQLTHKILWAVCEANPRLRETQISGKKTFSKFLLRFFKLHLVIEILNKLEAKFDGFFSFSGFRLLFLPFSV